MASVTYGKCYLWQKYYVKCNYGKNIMANETEPLGGLVDGKCTWLGGLVAGKNCWLEGLFEPRSGDPAIGDPWIGVGEPGV